MTRLYRAGGGNCEPIREVERVTVTRIDSVIGRGTEDDPVRIVQTWITDEGELLVHFDPQDSYQEHRPEGQ